MRGNVPWACEEDGRGERTEARGGSVHGGEAENEALYKGECQPIKMRIDTDTFMDGEL